MRAAILLCLASNAGLFACADNGDENQGGASGAADAAAKPPGESPPPDAVAKLVEEAIAAHMRTFHEEFSARSDIAARLTALESKPASQAAEHYEKLHALLMETRGHVDNLSREVSSLRRG